MISSSVDKEGVEDKVTDLTNHWPFLNACLRCERRELEISDDTDINPRLVIAHHSTAAIVSRAFPFRAQILFVVNLRSLDIQEVQSWNEENYTSGCILSEILQELLFFWRQLRLSLVKYE